MRSLFALTLGLSAALLFTVQPLLAKMLLPQLGGSPAVWNTCLVFFQGGLLAGYAYAHLLSRWRRPFPPIALHLGVVGTAMVAMPVGLPGSEPTGSPVAWLLGTLALAVGLPFFVLASTGPLLQRWFAETDHPDARDPYFLYAASNAGSLGGLLAYPLLFEPLLRVGTAEPAAFAAITQRGAWSLGYVAFAGLAVACAGQRVRRGAGKTSARAAVVISAPPTAATRLRWVLLALAPSSLLLGVTQHLTTDVAAIPLLWVMPLAIYLGTYVLAFSRGVRIPPRGMSATFALLAVGAAVSLWALGRQWPWIGFGIHLMTLAAAGLVCHGRLAAERPAADRLTEFYLWIAVGGVLGGAFNALLAPVLFKGIVEYPIALVLACWLRPEWEEAAARRGRLGAWVADLGLPAAIGAVALALRALFSRVNIGNPAAELVFQIGIPASLCLGLVGWRRRFALGVAVLLVFGWLHTTGLGDAVHRERSFFGVLRVMRKDTPPFPTIVDGETRLVVMPYHVLMHGTTRHGQQALFEGMRDVPTAYYHRTGPIGQVFEALGDSGRLDRAGFVGLGVGTLAAYGREASRFTYYEIDPAVIRIARDDGYFTFLRDSPAQIDYVVGDGRLSLAKAPDGEFGLIVLDAFSSDAIPVHLLTREAVEGYVRKLRPDGILALHLTNQFLELDRVAAAIAEGLGLAVVFCLDESRTPQDVFEGKDGSLWALVARDPRSLRPFTERSEWVASPPGGGPVDGALWTDDFSNILTVLKRG